MSRLRARWRWFALIALLFAVVLFAWTWGAPLSVFDLWSQDAERASIARRIFWREDGDWGLRPLRLCAGLLVGASLACAGASLQSVFRNPLAEPYLLGIASGGALGATLGLWIGQRANFTWSFGEFLGFDLGSNLSWLLAFAGALGASWLIYVLGSPRSSTRSRGNDARGGLLLTGVAVSAFLGALMSLVLALSSSADLAQQIVFWMMGTLARTDATQNFALFVALVFGLAILMFSSRDMNALRSGDEEAQTLGVDVRTLHFRLLFAAALMSAVAVASSGLIGFVGLLAPHIVRKLFGGDARVLVPASAFGGAILLVGCDAIARSIVPPIELPVGVITSLLGVPLFLWLARKA